VHRRLAQNHRAGAAAPGNDVRITRADAHRTARSAGHIRDLDCVLDQDWHARETAAPRA
jgi:hypothetical protein